jgi:hypothetical protein
VMPRETAIRPEVYCHLCAANDHGFEEGERWATNSMLSGIVAAATGWENRSPHELPADVVAEELRAVADRLEQR